jgi:uncharacterized protein (DUF1697 family)
LGRLGFEQVRTLLNSGNVIFSTSLSPKAAAAKIERAMEQDLGVPARALVLTTAELDSAVAGNRLTRVASNPSCLFVAFLWEPVEELERVRKLDWGSEVIAVGPRVAYLWCPEGFDTPLIKAFHKAVGSGVTVRSWSTVLKLHASLHLVATPVRARKRAPVAKPTRRAN